MQKNTLKLIRSGIIASLYIVLSLVTLPISGGAIQFRIAEGLTILPLFFLESVPALFVGCFLFNLISGLPFYDVILGSLITLAAAILTYFTGKILKNNLLKVGVGGFFPVILNALLLPVTWYYFSGELAFVYGMTVLSLLISQSLSIYVVGTTLFMGINKLKTKGIQFFE